jgi:hypothetical protein
MRDEWKRGREIQHCGGEMVEEGVAKYLGE